MFTFLMDLVSLFSDCGEAELIKTPEACEEKQSDDVSLNLMIGSTGTNKIINLISEQTKKTCESTRGREAGIFLLIR